MKKFLLHLGFWSVYFCQDTLLIYLVNMSKVQGTMPDGLLRAAANGLVLLLPKILFTYFILRFVLDKVFYTGRQARGFFYSVIALACTLLLYRMLAVYFVNPVIYQWNAHLPVLYALGLLVALMDVGFVAGVAIAVKQVRQQLSGKKREEQLVREKLESEIKFLRSQTNPHFLFNTLNNIYALARKKSDQTPEAVLKLSQLLRFMLYETSRPFIRIEDEVRVLDDYIELEQMRYSSRLTVNFYREIDNSQEPISPLLLLPFVENAFKHGPGESHSDSYIHIDMSLKNGCLNFSVENTKERSGEKAPGDNIGLRNVKRQLELMYADYSLEVENEPDLFKIALSIDLKTHEKNQLPPTGR